MMEEYKSNSQIAFISIVNLLIKIIIGGSSGLIYIICINVLNKEESSLGFAISISNLGFLAFSYWCGHISNKKDMRDSYLISLVLSCLSLISIFIYTFLDFDFYNLFLLSLLCMSFSSTLYNTTITSKLPEYVHTSELPLSNALVQLTSSIGSFIGPILIAFIFAHGNFNSSILVLVLIDIINILIIATRLKKGKTRKISNEYEAKKSLNFITAIKYICNNRILLLIILCTLLLNFAFSLIEVAQIIHIITTWKLPETFALSIGSFTSIGAILAPIVIKKSYRFAILIGVVIPNLSMVLLLLPESKELILIIVYILLALSRNIGAVVRVTIQQLYLDPEIRGIITGAVMTITWGINPIGNILSGILIQYIGTTYVLGLASISIFTVSVLMIRLLWLIKC